MSVPNAVRTPRPAGADSAATAAFYLVRLVFALVWAASFAVSAAGGLTTGAAVLVVVYPAVDAAAVLADAVLTGRRVPVTGAARRGLIANVAVSAAAAVALAVAATTDVPAVLRVWGAWAVVAGLGQLVVAVARRRSHSGQWPLIVSGGLSCVVGSTFVAQASAPHPELSGISGYAVVGAVFFTVALLRLRWSRRAAARTA